jgi:hypothetical protein
MSEKYSFGVILDANVWVSERLLKSTIGSATLFAISQGGGFIGLPEIVELEAEKILVAQAEKAVEDIRKDIQLLNQLSGTSIALIAPDPKAIKKGICERWQQLEGILKRVPFTHEHAKSALLRVIDRLPPCGENNEQFRDSCIWEVALELAIDCPVHLITNDSAFYESRNRSRGLATQLLAEVKERNLDVLIHITLGDFLTSMKATVARLDKAALAAKIGEAVTPIARDFVAEKGKGFELGRRISSRIKGFATPKPAIFAVSFVTSFEMTYVKATKSGEDREDATLTLEGTCSYSQTSDEVSEIKIETWGMTSEGGGKGEWGRYYGPMERGYSNMRIIQ